MVQSGIYKGYSYISTHCDDILSLVYDGMQNSSIYTTINGKQLTCTRRAYTENYGRLRPYRFTCVTLANNGDCIASAYDAYGRSHVYSTSGYEQPIYIRYPGSYFTCIIRSGTRLIGTNMYRIMYSDDDGFTWVTAYYDNGNTLYIPNGSTWDCRIYRNEYTGTLIASVMGWSAGNGITYFYVSNDNGTSWTRKSLSISGFDRVSHIVPFGSNYIYCYSPHNSSVCARNQAPIYISSDEGTTWGFYKYATEPGYYHYIDICPITSDKVLINRPYAMTREWYSYDMHCYVADFLGFQTLNTSGTHVDYTSFKYWCDTVLYGYNSGYAIACFNDQSYSQYTCNSGSTWTDIPIAGVNDVYMSSTKFLVMTNAVYSSDNYSGYFDIIFPVRSSPWTGSYGTFPYLATQHNNQLFIANRYTDTIIKLNIPPNTGSIGQYTISANWGNDTYCLTSYHLATTGSWCDTPHATITGDTMYVESIIDFIRPTVDSNNILRVLSTSDPTYIWTIDTITDTILSEVNTNMSYTMTDALYNSISDKIFLTSGTGLYSLDPTTDIITCINIGYPMSYITRDYYSSLGKMYGINYSTKYVHIFNSDGVYQSSISTAANPTSISVDHGIIHVGEGSTVRSYDTKTLTLNGAFYTGATIPNNGLISYGPYVLTMNNGTLNRFIIGEDGYITGLKDSIIVYATYPQVIFPIHT